MRKPDAPEAVGSRQSAVGQDSIAGCRPPIAGMDAGRAQIVSVARNWIGTPYRHQGALKGVGCDCLGLLVGVWRELESTGCGRRDAVPPKTISVPVYTPDWAEALGRETFAEGLREHLSEIEVGEAREGDLVLFRWRTHLPAKHGAILTARDRMVHAQEGAAVTEVAVSDWWRRRMAYAFSFDAPNDGLPGLAPSNIPYQVDKAAGGI